MGETSTLTKMNHIGFFTFVLFWCGLIVLCSLYMTIPLLSVFQEEFNIGASQAAWAGSIFSVFFSIGCLFFGVLSGKLGMKRVMVWGMACLSISTFLVGISDSYEQLLLFRGLQGLSAATFSPVALTYIGTVFPTEKRGTTIGFVSLGFLMAGIIGQLMSSFIEPRLDWHAVFFVFGGMYVFTILLLSILPKDESGNQQSVTTVLKKLITPFRDKLVVVTYCIAITILMSFVGMYTALGEYLALTFNFNNGDIFLVRAAGIFGILLAPFTGMFVTKFGLYRMLHIGLMLSILGLFVIGFSKQLSLIIVMSVVFVSGIALIVPVLISLVAHLGAENKGIVMAVYTFILFVGASLGPILATAMMHAHSAILPFIVFGCLLVIGLLLSIYLAVQESG